MSETDIMQVDFLARVEELQALSALKAQAVEQRISAQDWHCLCPDGDCEGMAVVPLPGHEGRFPAACRLYQTLDCPRYRRMAEAAEMRFMRGVLGLEDGEDSELLHATEAGLTPGFQQAVSRWCSTAAERLRRGEGLILGGGYGSGKSSACMVVARAAYRAGATVCWVESAVAFDELYRGQMQRLKPSADLLILDDFGFEYRGEVVMPRFHVLMNERWHKRRATVIATMQTQKTLEADPGLGAILSRLRQRNVWQQVATEDRRKHMSLSDWA